MNAEMDKAILLLARQAKEAEARAEQLRNLALEINDEVHTGTALNEVDVQQHTCYALGVLLGQEAAVRHLQIRPTVLSTGRTWKEAYAFRSEAQSLENFCHVVRRVSELTSAQRASEWNLDCLGEFGVAGQPVQVEGTFYLLQEQGRVLRILGDVERGFASKLREAVERNPVVRVIAIGSRGGSVGEALEAGRYIRAKGLETTLWNNCYSAAPLVFAGGVQRTIWSPYPKLGFHKMYTQSGQALALDDMAYRLVANYLVEMKVSPAYVITRMAAAEPHQMFVVDGNDPELGRSGLATWIQRQR